jgi:uncharacterized protein (UPF0218 family)
MYFKLNPSVRKLLAHPMGELFTGPPLESIPKAILWMQSIRPSLFSDLITEKSSRIICVGDVVSKHMMEHPLLGRIIKMCFVDGETQRGAKIHFNLPEGMLQKTVTNPRGMINSEVATFIQKYANDPLQYFVMVDGEEDLLVLPAILDSPDDTFVFYGQPPNTDADPPIPAGCVGIHVTADLKQNYRKVLDRFDRIVNL